MYLNILAGAYVLNWACPFKTTKRDRIEINPNYLPAKWMFILVMHKRHRSQMGEGLFKLYQYFLTLFYKITM